MTTTVTIQVNKRTKAGKAFLALVDTILKNQTGIKVMEENTDTSKPVTTKKAKIIELSKKINKAGTQKAFAELGLNYDRYSRQ